MQTEKANPAEQELFASILVEKSIDAIIAIDSSCNITAWNNAAELIYGIPKEQAEGASLFQVIPAFKDDDEIKTAIANALNGYKSFVPASKFAEHRHHIENYFIPLDENNGSITGVMNIAHNVVNRVKAEEQLQEMNEELRRRYRQLQATVEELTSYTYFTTNKIKEPIRNIYTGIEHMIKVEAGRMTDSGKASFRRIQSSLNRMDLLLDDILSLSQISILQEPDTDVDLNLLLQEVADAIKNSSDKKANIIIGELGIMRGHRNYLYALFYNLLDNAIKFNENQTPEINIACKKVTWDNEDPELTDEPEYYKISITDNGIGFSKDDAKRIFLMFEKLHDKKYKGSGAGLAIARKIMHAHNGFISAEGEPGKGASFHCFFPVNNNYNSSKKFVRKII